MTSDDYLIGPDDFGYDDIEPWTFTVDGVVTTWRPEFPYLFGDSSEASRKIIKQVAMLIENIAESEPETMNPGITGIEIPTSESSPYMVFYAVTAIYDEEDGLKFSDNATTLYPESELGDSETLIN